jgi:hypothetical protein
VQASHVLPHPHKPLSSRSAQDAIHTPYTDDLAFATELPVDAAAELVHVQEDANMLALDQDEDNGRWFVELRGRLKPSGIGFLEELRKFVAANKIAVGVRDRCRPAVAAGGTPASSADR